MKLVLCLCAYVCACMCVSACVCTRARPHTHPHTHTHTHKHTHSRDSSDSIANHYGLDRPGIESWWWRDFLHPSRSALGPAMPPMQCIPGLIIGVQLPGLRVEHPHLSSGKTEETSPLGFMTCSGVSFA